MDRKDGQGQDGCDGAHSIVAGNWIGVVAVDAGDIGDLANGLGHYNESNGNRAIGGNGVEAAEDGVAICRQGALAGRRRLETHRRRQRVCQDHIRCRERATVGDGQSVNQVAAYEYQVGAGRHAHRDVTAVIEHKRIGACVRARRGDDRNWPGLRTGGDDGPNAGVTGWSRERSVQTVEFYRRCAQEIGPGDRHVGAGKTMSRGETRDNGCGIKKSAAGGCAGGGGYADRSCGHVRRHDCLQSGVGDRRSEIGRRSIETDVGGAKQILAGDRDSRSRRAVRRRESRDRGGQVEVVRVGVAAVGRQDTDRSGGRSGWHFRGKLAEGDVADRGGTRAVETHRGRADVEVGAADGHARAYWPRAG